MSTFQSFASAAAGANLTNGVRKDGGNEWSRTRPNGSTQTFRRTSSTAVQSRDNSQIPQPSSSTGPYIPPHMNQPHPSSARSGSSSFGRYTVNEMWEIFRRQKEMGAIDKALPNLFQGPWDYSRDESLLDNSGKDPNVGAEVCWRSQAESELLSMQAMSEEEKQFFSSVNAPTKPQSKEGGNTTTANRKASLSNTFSTATGTGRPGPRRRETGDSVSGVGPQSPSDSKTLFRTDPLGGTPPNALLRRRTDAKEDESRIEADKDEPLDTEGRSNLAGLGRLSTGPLSASVNGPTASPWSAGGSRSAFESMGGFGSFNVGDGPTTRDSDKRPGFGSARGSRFKDLLAKTSIEDVSSPIKERPSQSSLEKLPEENIDVMQLRPQESFRTRPARSETNPYHEQPRSSSAALSNDGQQADHGLSVAKNAQGLQSPAHTNPYQSPAAQRQHDQDTENESTPQHPFQHLGEHRDAFDGQYAGFGGSRSSLNNISGFPGWPESGFGSGTPTRDRPSVSSAFGSSLFSPMTDLQSPGAGVGGGFFGGSAFGSAGRGSRLNGMFPPAMQDQMRSESRGDGADHGVESSGTRDPFASAARRPDSFRNFFDDRPADSQSDSQSGPLGSAVATGSVQRSSTGPELGADFTGMPSHAPPGVDPTLQPAHHVPTAQQRQMVMPDRMRWIYKDPQGKVQGPWSGLEMHDWFKAGFFTAELQVKKLEDEDYEPLAQLVRRIGNSREPFLVPQIGIAHGPQPHNQANHWATSVAPTGVQPPFANAFPSFGTTLTAEQQNALERRKQEEQFLMARQKEYLAHHQMSMKYQMQVPGLPTSGQPLQHHASSHSLHSQPSVSSITSPAAYQPSPMQAPIGPPPQYSGFPGPNTPQKGREEDLPGMMDRMNFQQRAGAPYNHSPIGQQHGALGSNQPTRTKEFSQADARAHEESFLGRDGRNERLEEFQHLRKQADDGDENLFQQSMVSQRPIEESSVSKPAPIGRPDKLAIDPGMSLTEQVQMQAAAIEKAAAHDRHTIEVPPVSVSPLPAPTPNRNRQHVADALAAESRSQSQTPVEPASLAPWAQAELPKPKGPSLKEIQEAEARRAAEQQALLDVARKEQAERERLVAATVIPPAPGLPAASNWASTTSPASPVPAGSAWGSKPAAKPATASATKKTLAQIQKEEEARKQKLAAQVAQAQVTAYASSNAAVGKRYAELASKIAPAPAANQGTSAWTTVGASGKAKTPLPPAVVPTPQPTRSVSSGNAATAKARPTLQTTRTMSTNTKSKADEELLKWARIEISPHLKSNVNPEDFIQLLMNLPPNDKDLVQATIYNGSDTLNVGHMADEWIRRRKLAEKGFVEAGDTAPSAAKGAGGWSEVAKKGPTKEDPNTNSTFKVVASKKKSSKR